MTSLIHFNRNNKLLNKFISLILNKVKMNRNHPVNLSYRTMKSVDKAYESGREAGFSTCCVSTVFLIFLGIILIPLIFI